MNLFKANVAIRLSINFVMAPCKRHLKATRHLICSSCSNWVDFVKSGCEKSWAEVQADSFSFECRGCMRMKELEVELEQLRLLVVTGRRETGRKETGHRETGRKETRRKEMGGKTSGSKERGVGETVAKESGGGGRRR